LIGQRNKEGRKLINLVKQPIEQLHWGDEISESTIGDFEKHLCQLVQLNE
jgi:hypothetical protein